MPAGLSVLGISRQLTRIIYEKNSPSPTNVIMEGCDGVDAQQGMDAPPTKQQLEQPTKKAAQKLGPPSKRHSALVVPRSTTGKHRCSSVSRPRQQGHHAGQQGRSSLHRSLTAEGFKCPQKTGGLRSQTNEDDGVEDGGSFKVLAAHAQTPVSERTTLGSLFQKTSKSGTWSSDAKSCAAEFHHSRKPDEDFHEQLRLERKEKANQLAKTQHQQLTTAVTLAVLLPPVIGSSKVADASAACSIRVGGEQLGQVIGPVVSSYINQRASEATGQSDIEYDDDDADNAGEIDGDNDFDSIADKNHEVGIDTDDDPDDLAYSTLGDNSNTGEIDPIQRAFHLADETVRRQIVAEAVLNRDNPLVKMFANIKNGPVEQRSQTSRQNATRPNSETTATGNFTTVNTGTAISNLVAALSKNTHVESRADPVAHAEELRRQRKAKANELAMIHKEEDMMDDSLKSSADDRRSAVIAALLSESGQNQPLSEDLRGMLQATLHKMDKPKSNINNVASGVPDDLSRLVQKAVSSRYLSMVVPSKQVKKLSSSKSFNSGVSTVCTAGPKTVQADETLQQNMLLPKQTKKPPKVGVPNSQKQEDLPSHLKKPNKDSKSRSGNGESQTEEQRGTQDCNTSSPTKIGSPRLRKSTDAGSSRRSKSKNAHSQRPRRSKSTTNANKSHITDEPVSGSDRNPAQIMDASLALDDITPPSRPSSARQRSHVSRREDGNSMGRKSMPNLEGDLDSSSELEGVGNNLCEPNQQSTSAQKTMPPVAMKRMPNVVKPDEDAPTLNDSIELEQLHRNPRRYTGSNRQQLKMSGKSMPNVLRIADSDESTAPKRRSTATTRRPIQASESFDGSMNFEDLADGTPNLHAAAKQEVKGHNSRSMVSNGTPDVAPRSEQSNRPSQMCGQDSLSNLKLADLAPTRETKTSTNENDRLNAFHQSFAALAQGAPFTANKVLVFETERQKAFHESFAAGDLEELFPIKKKSSNIPVAFKSRRSFDVNQFGKVKTAANQDSMPNSQAFSVSDAVGQNKLITQRGSLCKKVDPETTPGMLNAFLTIVDDNCAMNHDAGTFCSRSLAPSKQDATTQKRTRSKSATKVPQTPLTEIRRPRRRVSISASSASIPNLNSTGHSSQGVGIHDNATAEMGDGSQKKFKPRRQRSDVSGLAAQRHATGIDLDALRTPGRTRMARAISVCEMNGKNLELLRNPARKKGFIGAGTASVDLNAAPSSQRVPKDPTQVARKSLPRGHMSERSLQISKTPMRKSRYMSSAGAQSHRTGLPRRHKSHDFEESKRQYAENHSVESVASTKVSSTSSKPRRHQSHDGPELVPTCKSRPRRNKTGEGIIEGTKSRKSTSVRPTHATPRRRHSSRRIIVPQVASMDTSVGAHDEPVVEESHETKASAQHGEQRSNEKNDDGDASRSQPKTKLRSLFKAASAMNLMGAMKADDVVEQSVAKEAAKDMRDEQTERLRQSLMRGKTDSGATTDAKDACNGQQVAQQVHRPGLTMGKAASLRNLFNGTG